MESPGPENSSIDLKKAADELVRGRESATQLQIIFRDNTRDHGSVTADELIARILKSFTEAISVLNSGVSSEVFGDPATAEAGLSCCDGQRTEDSGEKRKKQVSTDHRRGGYKRRKMLETYISTTSKPIEDGYSWRKYGQKEILNAKFPRSYFRCTHRHDQGCLATKQVQKTEDETPMYRTTYIGHHTCRDVLKAPQFLMDDIPGECLVFGFESNLTTKQELPSFSSLPYIKEEYKEKAAFTDLTAHDNQSSSEYFLLPDLKPLESSGPTSVLPSTPGSDYGDVSGVYSCCSHSSFDMGIDSIDCMVDGSVDFDDVFKFDEEILF
ncbi:hypothetical protein NE237_008965 [Protea cynaroides]|uniref:WRKY domain-containing protein n=1 Tax=Protea cynaroides TaxID=273540 RepID=A0A9Q0KWU2_9MAGN|nr:hypothetical protein NE237_008965 [Protea cynaroides]